MLIDELPPLYWLLGMSVWLFACVFACLINACCRRAQCIVGGSWSWDIEESMVTALVLASRFLSWLNSYVTSLKEGL